jgi:hypothetical protein
MPSSNTTESSSSIQRQLEVIGKPIKKSVFNRYADNMDSFIDAHAGKLRFMQAQIAAFTQVDIDDSIQLALDPLITHEIRAKHAYQAYAWMRTFRAFEHPAREHYINLERLAEPIKLHPDYLYRYGLFFRVEPDKEVHDQLVSLHAPTAKMYMNYCIAARVAELTGYDIKALVNW